MSNAEIVVLISGVNGFIGSQTALSFLDAGYTVKGTIRTQAKADEYAAKHSSYESRLTVSNPTKTLSHCLIHVINAPRFLPLVCYRPRYCCSWGI